MSDIEAYKTTYAVFLSFLKEYKIFWITLFLPFLLVSILTYYY